MILTALLSATHTQAVVYSNTTLAPKAVIAIGGKNGGMCSATIVGMNPPTVITAKHCAAANYVQFMYESPLKVITGDFESKEFSTEKSLLPGDFAVLIFSQNSAPAFQKRLGTEKVIKLSLRGPHHGEKITTCGYGSADPRQGYPNGMNTLRCGNNFALTEESKGKGKAKFSISVVNGNLSEYDSDTRIGITNVLPDGKIDKDHSLSLLQAADSGGPGLIIDETGELSLVSVNSITIFDAQIVYASILWRLDHPWSRDLLRKAIDEGADIQGMN